MGGMGGMAGFEGMGDMAMAGMYGNRMPEMDETDNAIQRDSLRDNAGFFGGNPYYSRGFGEGFRMPMRSMYPMVDEPAVGRDKVPLGYERRDRMPYIVPFRRHHYINNEEDFKDDEMEVDNDNDDDDNDDEPYFVPARDRAAFEGPFDEGPESEMDDGYDAPYDRKTKIAKVEKPKKKEKVKHNGQNASKERKKKVTVASKKHVTEKRGKTTGKHYKRKQ